MRICVAGPFNPYEFKEYFDDYMDIPNINITATSVNGYVLGLLKLGYRVTVITSYLFDGNSYMIEGKGLNVILVSSRFRMHAFGRMRMAYRIRRIIKPLVKEFDILHAEWTYEYALAVNCFAKRMLVFCSVRDWCPYLLNLAKGFKEKYYWYMSYCMFSRVMKNTDIHFIANSDYLYKKIKEKNRKLSVNIIYNPLNSKYLIEQKKNFVEIPTFISICVDLEEPRKNIPILLEAFQKYRMKYRDDAKLILVGEYNESFYNYYKQRDLLRSVDLIGKVSHQSVIDLIDKSTCLIHPSKEETFGNILLEGMCRWVPCIGGNQSGAVPAVLGNGEYGLLCDIANIDSIVSTMRMMENQELIERLTRNSYNYVKREFLENVIAEKHVILFQSKMKEREM